jgi:pimeloyl-ACP methyl ester carboxylesterase
MRRLTLIAISAFYLASLSPVAAATPEAPAGAGRVEPIPMPTLGGKQFWADELFFHQWRIQRNVLDGECRLLDENDCRHAAGTFDQCRNRLDEIKCLRHLAPMAGRAVVVLHGLGRTRGSMEKLCQCLRQSGGFSVFNVSYPSTRRGIAEHAQSLAHVVENLHGIDEISFVGHSMGNIVIRRYLFDQIDPATGRLRDPRFKRVVMLAPPNQGSELAAALAENGLFQVVEGIPGRELGADWPKLETKLAIPPLEFGIIAGGCGDAEGYNPMLPGDDDGIVTVASTRLATAADFVLLPVAHSFIMSDETAIGHTLRFLQTGRFVVRDRP